MSRATLITDTVGGVITNTYDNLDRMLSQQTAQGTLQYRYDAAGRQISMTVAGQPDILYTYDNANRPISLTQSGQSVLYGFDGINRRTVMTLTNGVAMQYGYDVASQLTTITYKFGGSTLGDLVYGFDKIGRQTSIGGAYGRTGIPATIASATYNAANQVTNWGGTTLAYDNNGSLTVDGNYTYTWNARNELASIAQKSNGVTVATLGQDAYGRRISKTLNGINRHYSKFTGNIVNLRSNERQETNNGRGEPAGTRRIHADRERAGREPGGGSPGADNPTKSELPATAVPMVWQIKLSG